MKRMAKKRPAPQWRNHFRWMDRPGGDDHPIDLIVRERAHQEEAQQRLLSLQREVEAQLGDNRGAFLKLETLRNDIRIDREEAYFNVGFEHGLVEGTTRAIGALRSPRRPCNSLRICSRSSDRPNSPEIRPRSWPFGF
jgi:hypothetical protein